MDASRAFEILARRMSVGLVVWQFDPGIESLRLVCANEAASVYAGIDLTSQTGRTIREILPNVTPDRHERYVNIARSDATPGALLRFEDTRTEHTTFSIRALAMPEQCVGIIFQDLADETSMLAQREKRFRALLEHSMDAIAAVDAEGRFLYVSPSVRRLLGYNPDGLLGTEGFALVHPNDEPAVREFFSRLLATPDQPFTQVTRARHQDGTWRLLEVVAVNRLNDSSVRAVVANFRDITEQQRTQQVLQNTEEQLRHAMKMEAVGRLAGGVAHDFNNLLSVVISYCDMLLEDPSAQYVHAELAEIRQAGERAAELTRQLLAFGRKQVLEPQIIDLNRVLASVTRLLDRVLGENIRVRMVPGSDLWPAKLDPGQIEQVLMNLAVNARDAMPKGGTLIVETSNIYLDQVYADSHLGVSPGPHVMLAVTDTGVGMDRAIQKRIFEPFFTTKDRGRGTGLGLSMVHGIVEQSGGSIWVYSEVGVGTTFKLYFPKVEADGYQLAPSTPSPPEPRGGSETILIVEDDASVRTVAHEILLRHGYTILTASSAAEAMRIAAGYPLDLLLTDVIMPDMNGPELAQRLLAQHRDLKVLFISGYTDNSMTLGGLLEQGAKYLQKPLTPDTLARKVRGVLDEETAQRAELVR